MNDHVLFLGRILGVPILLKWRLLALLLGGGAFLLLAFKDPAVGGGFLLGVALVLLSVIGHEVGHAVSARLVGLPVRSIVIQVLYAVTHTGAARTVREEVIVAGAGPVASLGLAGLAMFASLFVRHPLLAEGFATLVVVNLSLGMINLLPAFPMDGGRILRALLRVRLGPQRATSIALLVGRLLALLLLVPPFLPDVPPYVRGSPLLAILIVVLGERERRRLRRVELEEEGLVKEPLGYRADPIAET